MCVFVFVCVCVCVCLCVWVCVCRYTHTHLNKDPLSHTHTHTHTHMEHNLYSFTRCLSLILRPVWRFPDKFISSHLTVMCSLILFLLLTGTDVRRITIDLQHRRGVMLSTDEKRDNERFFQK